MKISDRIRLMNGTLHLQAIDIHGHELWRISEHNLIVAGGYKVAAEALAGVDGARIKSVSVGTNGSEPLETDTAITEAVIVDIQSVEYPDEATVRFNFTVGYNMGVGMEVREFGLITADGRLFSRKVRAAIEKSQYMSIVGQWDINI